MYLHSHLLSSYQQNVPNSTFKTFKKEKRAEFRFFSRHITDEMGKHKSFRYTLAYIINYLHIIKWYISLFSFLDLNRITW